MSKTADKFNVTANKPVVHFQLEQNYPISKLTTFGIGGPADWVAFCKNADEIKEAVEFGRQQRIDYVVIGGGSNVLASDEGYRGMIIVPQIDFCEIDDDLVVCGAGFLLRRLVELTVEACLAGFESLAGIAGTVGGAIVGNAGAYGMSISDTLIDVYLYHPTGGFCTVVKENLNFRYRHSDLKRSPNIVVSGRFKLKRDDAALLKKKTEDILSERWKRHPRENISAGCFFKNIESKDAPHGKIAAGYLLDQVGAKRMEVGHAGVFEGHANILINKGGATASEVRELSLQLKQKVKEIYGIDLCEEVVLLGDFS